MLAEIVVSELFSSVSFIPDDSWTGYSFLWCPLPDLPENQAAQELAGEMAFARMLISRLERLSVDSYWAHRSSGLRGSLMLAVERLEAPLENQASADIQASLQHLRELIDLGVELLVKAAREIPGDENHHRAG